MNKHKYIGWTSDDRTPRHMIGGPLTGWMYSDAVRQHKCPKCGSDPGYQCETPSGRKSWPPHSERLAQLTPEQVAACTTETTSITDILKGRQ